MKRLNLTGQKFGLLTVLEPDETHIAPNGRKKTMWKCQCECGNITSVQTSNLTNGHTTSCGCKAGRTNIIGERFGRLVVLQYTQNSKYLCLCDCGNEVEVATNNLKNGNTKSCGCLQRDKASEANLKSLIGQRFGKLLVINRVENDRFGHVNYKCKCDCGGITIVDAGNLRRGTTSSCGCIKSKGEMLINKWLQEHHINFIPQYSHDQIILESGRKAIFDFAIFNSNGTLKCFIEFNGKQHYEATGGWNTEEYLKITQYRDRQKEEWCKKLNIPLYKIKYDEDISKMLEGLIKETAEKPDMEEMEDL